MQINIQLTVILRLHIKESYVTVRAYEFLRLMPRACAIVGRIENADAVLYGGTALIKAVVDYLFALRGGSDGSRAVVTVLRKNIVNAAVTALDIGISDTLSDKRHSRKAAGAGLAHDHTLTDISL